jgi:uncharacterized protein YdhG (YjbR/CyaY superfamily)
MSKAATVQEYLAELAPETRAGIQKVRSVIRRNLPKGYKEDMLYGMICYFIPFSRYDNTYNDQPLCYAALAAQKRYNAVYVMTAYSDAKTEKSFRARWKATGKKLDMGKSCIRFQTPDDLALDLIGDIIGATSVDEYIAWYEANRGKTATAKAERQNRAALKARKKGKKK